MRSSRRGLFSHNGSFGSLGRLGLPCRFGRFNKSKLRFAMPMRCRLCCSVVAFSGMRLMPVATMAPSGTTACLAVAWCRRDGRFDRFCRRRGQCRAARLIARQWRRRIGSTGHANAGHKCENGCAPTQSRFHLVLLKQFTVTRARPDQRPPLAAPAAQVSHSGRSMPECNAQGGRRLTGLAPPSLVA